jgi:hypothetical protein
LVCSVWRRRPAAACTCQRLDVAVIHLTRRRRSGGGARAKDVPAAARRVGVGDLLAIGAAFRRNTELGLEVQR